MKHRKKADKDCSAAARKLISEAFTELQADAMVNGWGTALGNLHRKTKALHASNYITDDILETQEDGAFVNETLGDELCCPYCMGQSETPILNDNVSTYKCKSCGRTYEIEYSMSSVGTYEQIDYNNIIDIRKNDEDSLFIGGDR
jgi:transcription elongation factor Elf1